MTPELRKRLIYVGGGALLILAVGGTVAYLINANSHVYIDTASIQAPLIDLAPTSSGRLNALYANVGDTLPAHTPVAEVGDEVIATKVAGLIVAVNDVVGGQVSPGESVVTMIDPSALRVVARLDENKGLAQLQVGDLVTFTVDAFGSERFDGVVDEIAPTSNQSGIVFNISSQRQVQQFDIKIRFDTSAYPMLRNGMSARVWIYPQ